MVDFFMNNVFFDFVPTLVVSMIVIVIVITIFKNLSEWIRNNNSPKLNVNAKVISRRTDITRLNSKDGAYSTDTKYFVTFEFDTGDRLELKVSGFEYGQLCEQDVGVLSFQGRRYLGFKRNF